PEHQLGPATGRRRADLLRHVVVTRAVHGMLPSATLAVLTIFRQHHRTVVSAGSIRKSACGPLNHVRGLLPGRLGSGSCRDAGSGSSELQGTGSNPDGLP